MKDISLVIPLLNEEESLTELSQWISKVMLQENLTYEIIFVDDGSKDNSWEVIKDLTLQNTHIKGIRFSRNYGKSAALNTGFQHTEGRVVITMDADLQDSPEEIPELYRMIMVDQYDLVSGWKKERHDSFIKNNTSKLYNYITRLFSGIKLHDFNCGLKSYHYKVVKNIEVYGEMHRYIPVIAKWAGFTKIGEKVVRHQARKYGKSKFGLERFVNGLLDLLSITFVSRFKKRPMHFFGSLGILSFGIGALIALWLIVNQLFFPVSGQSLVTERPLFYLGLVAIVVGTQLFLAGFIAELITTNSHKSNDYVISEKTGLE